MKFAAITDIHVGESAYHNGIMRKLSQYAKPLISDFVNQVNARAEAFDFAIQVGDLIEDESHEADYRRFDEALRLFSPLKVPMHHVLGNHDTVYLSHEDRSKLLGQDRFYYSFDQGDCHCVVLHSQVPSHALQPIHIPQDQIDWLEDDLKQTRKPTIVFVHHALADQDLSQNPWHDGIPEQCLIRNRAEVRQILADSNKVVAVMNGHLHWNRIDVHDGIVYVTLQSATENFLNAGVPAASWAEVSLLSDRLSVKVHGNDVMSFEQRYPLKVLETLDQVPANDSDNFVAIDIEQPNAVSISEASL